MIWVNFKEQFNFEAKPVWRKTILMMLKWYYEIRFFQLTKNKYKKILASCPDNHRDASIPTLCHSHVLRWKYSSSFCLKWTTEVRGFIYCANGKEEMSFLPLTIIVVSFRLQLRGLGGSEICDAVSGVKSLNSKRKGCPDQGCKLRECVATCVELMWFGMHIDLL